MTVLVLIGLGLILGSFINAFIWRLHEGKDWVRGRSECVHCHHHLAAKDLVPVLSYLWLRGKCRYCGKNIDDTPLAELVLPALFVASYVWWPLSFEAVDLCKFIFWCIFLVAFVALALYDLKWFLLPNKIVFPLTGLVVMQVVVVAIWAQDWHVLLGAAGGAVAVGGLFYLLFRLSHGTWIGGGDVKLGVPLGLLAGGLVEGFLLLFVASVSATLATVPLLVRGKAHRKTHVPFGPFLILGIIIVTLFGAHIIDWYSGLFYV